MIQRLHLEEAQQPSAYAINAARESGAYKEDKENESLALEFQSLLAQITGKLAAVPDQALAVGLALAQTAAPQHLNQQRDIQLQDKSDEYREDSIQQDSQSQDSMLGDNANQVQVRSQGGERRAETESRADDDDDRGEEREVSNDTIASEDISQEELIGEIQAAVVTNVTQVVSDDAQVADAQLQIAQGDMQEEVLEDKDSSLVVTSSDTGVEEQTGLEEGKELVQQQVKVSVKGEKKADSDEEVEVEQVATMVADALDRGDQQALQGRKGAVGGHKSKDGGDDLHGLGRHEQVANSSAGEQRNQSQNNSRNEYRESQEFELGSLNQRLAAEGTGKSGKAHKQKDSVDTLEGFSVEPPRETGRVSESNLQMTMLRYSFDALRANKADGAEKAIKPQVNAVNSAGASTEAKSSQSEQSNRASSKGLARPQVAKMLERVEATLKEAARSRDGRTISLHLEPVNLGKVKVDVSLRDGALHARIAPENQQVTQALREHAYDLQGSLRKLGLDVETVSVSVTSESFEGEMNTGQQMFDGRSFQDDRNNMPHERAQVPETTVGNELAGMTSAGAEKQGSTTGNVLDHWVA